MIPSQMYFVGPVPLGGYLRLVSCGFASEHLQAFQFMLINEPPQPTLLRNAENGSHFNVEPESQAPEQRILPSNFENPR